MTKVERKYWFMIDESKVDGIIWLTYASDMYEARKRFGVLCSGKQVVSPTYRCFASLIRDNIKSFRKPDDVMTDNLILTVNDIMVAVLP